MRSSGSQGPGTEWGQLSTSERTQGQGSRARGLWGGQESCPHHRELRGDSCQLLRSHRSKAAGPGAFQGVRGWESCPHHPTAHRASNYIPARKPCTPQEDSAGPGSSTSDTQASKGIVVCHNPRAPFPKHLLVSPRALGLQTAHQVSVTGMPTRLQLCALGLPQAYSPSQASLAPPPPRAPV